MRTRSSFLFLAAAVLVVAACSSTTVVAGDDRPAVPATGSTSEGATSDTTGDNPSDDGESTGDNPSDDGETFGDQSDSDRGERDTGTDPDADDTEEDRPTPPRDLEEASGFGLGGAEQLAGLLTDCEAGDDLACDILFQISDFGSAEETAALTCGGRSDVEVFFCTDGIVPIDGELVFDETSPGLPQIVSLCQGGNMTACDFLFFRSPIDSGFEDLGGTCGSRVEVAVPDCRTFLSDE